MRKTRVGAALLAVALLLELFANLNRATPRPRPLPVPENSIQTRQEDIDKDGEKAGRAAAAARLRELARALRSALPATVDHATAATDGAVGPPREPGDGALPSILDPDLARGKFSHFSAEELALMAGRCELRWQLPPFGATAPSSHGPEYDRALAAARDRYREAAAALYREATGRDADQLGLRALDDALRSGATADPVSVHRRLAGERAGDPPTGEARSIYERWLEVQLAAGDDFESALAEAVGPSQAQAWRQGAGDKMVLTGCDNDHSLFRSLR